MSIKVRIDLRGFDLLEPKIKHAVQRGIEKAGRMIERDAKIFSPIRTGRLRSSINSIREGFRVTIQDNVNYGIYQEFGTRFMKGKPFMMPSLRKNIPLIASTIVREVRSVLR